ncbi:MAG: hypothetical protein INR72_19520 [Williamsia herbipolensis]|nr:hypothetical protein [Williamsia herbipolensis]
MRRRSAGTATHSSLGAHPLRVSEVMRLTGAPTMPATDAAIWTSCPRCGQHQSLADATIEPAERAHDITAYRCTNGCTVLAATGFATKRARGNDWRYEVGQFVVAAQVPGGLQFVMRARDTAG